jgi:hypothetical protein
MPQFHRSRKRQHLHFCGAFYVLQQNLWTCPPARPDIIQQRLLQPCHTVYAPEKQMIYMLDRLTVHFRLGLRNFFLFLLLLSFLLLFFIFLLILPLQTFNLFFGFWHWFEEAL